CRSRSSPSSPRATTRATTWRRRPSPSSARATRTSNTSWWTAAARTTAS
ncbi:MAG: hypothetical protein AVDCRST_MAG64-62, partial [uncultured Phycisphaerae bacterium]